jgi:PKD repeat protein
MKMKTFSLAVVIVCGVLLLVSGAAAAESASITISGNVVTTMAPIADFTASPTTGYPPHTVRFTDLSSGSQAEWQWDFENDGIIDATVPDPVHTYTLPGIYTISLTVRNAGGAYPETKSGYITVEELDPVVRIKSLEGKIQDLHSIEWSAWLLIRPLERASGQVEKGRNEQAIHQINTFIQVVDLLHGFQGLTDAQATYLTTEATAIIGLVRG